MQPRGKIFIITLLTISLIFTNCVFGKKAEEKFEKEIEFVSSGLITLKNTNGSVHIDSWSKATVKIVAIKTVRAGSYRTAEQFLEKVEIIIEQFSNEIQITADYPRKGSASGFWNLFSGSKKPQVNIQYELTVPEDSELDIRTTNGAVKIEEVFGNILARTTNGAVNLENVNGNAIAKTTNGSVKASFIKFQKHNEIELRSTNGRIYLELPENTSARLSARTTNGKISTDFPVNVLGGLSSRKIEGTIGNGNGKIDLRTTNGSITIKSR